jgi:hypothetical protein
MLLNILTGWYDTSIFLLSMTSITESNYPLTAFLKLFKVVNNSEDLLLFVSESAIFYPLLST